MHAVHFIATMYLCTAMYALLRSILFQFAPEAVHVWTMRQLDRAYSIAPIRFLLKRSYQKKSASLHRKLWGIDFPNPVGLAAGFDKDAKHIDALACLGFGFIEIGTLTPKAQDGNPAPRLFRLPTDKALINRMGFNNDGVKVISERLEEWKKNTTPHSSRFAGLGAPPDPGGELGNSLPAGRQGIRD